MIHFKNNGILVETEEEIPWHLIGAENVYLDFETTSHNSKEASTNPWHNCHFLGACVTIDDCPNAWYLSNRLPVTTVHRFLLELLLNCKRWINHNVKYDMHCFTNFFNEVLPEEIQYIDTLTLAKIVNSDRFTYNLTVLSKDWLHKDISPFEKAMDPYFYYASGNRFNKDYGEVPTDILAEYGCQDVLTNRELYYFILENIHPDCERIKNTEIQLTYILYKIERNGMRVDMARMVKDGFKRIPRLLSRIQDKILSETGQFTRPNVNEDCYKLLCVKYGLPVLEYTEETDKGGGGNPSFGKDALIGYLAHPNAPKKIVRYILWYRRFHKIHTSFTVPYLKLQVNGYVHGFYNQMVRTGRLSCSEPNMQQLPLYVKYYVIPEEDCIIVSIDLSQIEFRIIAHYINQEDVIQRLIDGEDFHTLVANLCGIERQPAKTVNFLTSYGGGKYKLRQEFKKNPALAGSIPAGEDFELFCTEKADYVNEAYHKQLHNLKPTMRRASNSLRQRKYVKTLFGRHRHLPIRVYSKKKNRWFDVTYKAFNTASQGSAADLMKDITIRLYDLLKGYQTKMIGLVHDDWVFQVPRKEFDKVVPKLKEEIEKMPEGIELRVPIKADVSYSDKNWRMCK